MTMTTAAKAWLTIAYGGGRWTVKEVREALPEENANTLDNAVESMGDRRYLEVHEPTPGHPVHRYSVTGECLIPSGLHVSEVIEAMGMIVKRERERTLA
jgi:hypothetical protein